MPRRDKRQKSADEQAADAIRARAVDLGAVGLQSDAAVLERQTTIEVTRAGDRREGRKVEEDSARRMDAVEAVKHGMAKADEACRAKGKPPIYVGCYDAARRFERHIIASLGLHDRGGPTERVDGTPKLTGRMDTMIEADCRVRRIRACISDREWWFWRECFTASQDWPTWRHLVQHVSGETHTHAQAAAVRGFCLNIRDAYAATDRRAAA